MFCKITIPDLIDLLQDCAAVILYAAEAATKVALDALQILGQ